MRRFAYAWLMVAVLASPFALPSAGATPQERAARATSPIKNFVMDGATVAYSNLPPELRVVTWDVRTGRQTLVSDGEFAQAVDGLAVAGTRVAWIAASYGNTEYVASLYTSSITGQGEHLVVRARRYLDEDCSTDPPCTYGSWVDGLVGSGNLLAVSRWTTDVTNGVETVSRRRLSAIGARNHLSTLASGAGAIVAQSSDSGRIAVLRPLGNIHRYPRYSGSSIGIYSAQGRLLRELRPPAVDLAKSGIARTAEVVLDGDHLAILTTHARLKLYNWRNGRLLHSWQLSSGAGHLDLYGQIASYLVTRGIATLTLHVRQLTSGRDVIFRRLSRPSGFVGVGIEKPGLAYAWDGRKGGNLRFVAMARVLAAFSKT
jgi:hypothetical protein